MSVIISSDLVLVAGVTEEPLTHARIGYKKISGTITASTTEIGSAASAPDNEMTYSFWQPTTMPATWEIDTTTGTDVNYMAIAAHTCGTDVCSVKAEYWNGSAWIEINETLPGDDSPIMFIFDKLTQTKYRFTFAGSTAPRIGVIYIGMTLDMQRAIYGGHSPITLSRKTATRPNISESGQFLGRSIIAKGSIGSWEWKNLRAEWYRTNFDPFVENARLKPFFIAWRPETFPNEIGYCWTNQDIKPVNQGQIDMMSVSMTAEGLGND